MDAHSPLLVSATHVSYTHPSPAARDAGSDGESPVPALQAEPALDSPPASPAGCTLELPVRSVRVGDGPISFVTAVAGARSLLALSTLTHSVAWLSGSDQDVHTFESIATPQTALFAAGAVDTIVLGWTFASRAQDPRRTLRYARWNEPTEPSLFDLSTQFERSLVDVSCAALGGHGARCVLATNWREEFTPRDDLRAQWLQIDRDSSTQLTSIALLHGARAQSALLTPSTVGTVVQESATAVVSAQSTVLSPEPNVLDMQPEGSALLRLTASAPTAERCQLGRWTVSVHRAATQGASTVLQSTTTDAKPRGGRVRLTGSHSGFSATLGSDASLNGARDSSTPAAFWLDAPQCAEELFVVRSLRNGVAVTLARATEFDVASDRALLSLAWRTGDQLRWARYRCP